MSKLKPFQAILRDGRRVRVRPIRTEDRVGITAALARMSPRNRVFRFHRAVEQLTDSQLRYLTHVDYRDHMAWVACAVDETGQPIVAVARYVRQDHQPTHAETAIAVVDDYQGVGLGTLLMETLMLSALDNGIERLIAHVLPENRSARRLMQRLGGQGSRWEAGVLLTELPVGRGQRTWRSSRPMMQEMQEVQEVQEG